MPVHYTLAMRFHLLACLIFAAACGSPVEEETVLGNSPVVINEVSSKEDDPVELFNRSEAAVDLTGWYIVDQDLEHTPYAIPNGTTIAAGAYLVIQLKADVNHPFALGGKDKAHLYNADGQLADRASWADGQADVSFCRKPNGTGEFGTCAALSLGAANP